MSEHEHLTGIVARGYTRNMSEGGTAVLDNPREALSPALRGWQIPHDREDPDRRRTENLPPTIDQWLERKEKEIAANHTETKLNIPKVVVREKDSWREFGWEDDQKDTLKTMLQQSLVLKNVETKNLMELLLATGKKPEDLISQFNEALNYVRSPSKKLQKITDDEIINQQLNCLAMLGLNDSKQMKYLQRFVYTEHFRDGLTAELNREKPNNLYELAWQISFFDKKHQELFGINGEYPILEMRVDTDADGKVTGGRYVVNQANFMRWERERIDHWQDQKPDDYVEYFSEIQFKKDYSVLNLGEILNDHTKFFADENGVYYGDLAKQALLEPWMLGIVRKLHIIYKGVMSSDKEIIKQLEQLFANNPLTKKVYGKTLLYYMMTLPLDFAEGNKSDNTMGSAVNMMTLAYYNLSDYDKLEEVLGEDSKFFTREGMEDAIVKELKRKYENTEVTSQQLSSFLGGALKSFREAFGIEEKDGQVVNEGVNRPQTKKQKDAFVKFVNIFANMKQPRNVTDVINRALKEAIKEQLNFKSSQSTNKGESQDIDEYSLNVAGLIAEAMTRWTGIGAKNDTGAAGFDAMSKYLNFIEYRMKMATPDRGNAMGNPATVHQFKMLIVDYLRATRVSESTGANKERKTTLQVMEEMRFLEQHHNTLREKMQREMAQATDAVIKERLEKEIASIDTAAAYAYKQIAGQLEFEDNTMVNYVANHVARAQKIYEQVMGFKQIKFDDFVISDPLAKNYAFNREKFQAAIQEEFLKPLRYLISTYGDLDLSTPIRSLVFLGRGSDDKDKFEYRTMPLGQAMFGHQMLDIPEFRKRKKITKMVRNPETGKMEEKTVERGYLVENGHFVIDYEKVNANKDLVWKQWALTKLNGDLTAHIKKHSREPQFTAQYLFHVIEAIESIPSEIMGDEYNMAKTDIKSKVFSKEQIRWFKRLTKTTFFDLLRRSLKHDRKKKDPSGKGWADSFALLINTIFRGT